MMNVMWVKRLGKGCKCGWKGKRYNFAPACRNCLQDLDTPHIQRPQRLSHQGRTIRTEINSHGFPMLRPRLNLTKDNTEGRIRETGVDNGLEKERQVCN